VKSNEVSEMVRGSCLSWITFQLVECHLPSQLEKKWLENMWSLCLGAEKGLDSRVNEIAMEITEMWGSTASFESFTLGSLMPMIVLMSGRLVFLVIFGS
jgi:hypothetical protein